MKKSKINKASKVLGMVLAAILVGTLGAACEPRDDDRESHVVMGPTGGFGVQRFSYDLADPVSDIEMAMVISGDGCVVHVDVCYLDICDRMYQGVPFPDSAWAKVSAYNSVAVDVLEEDMHYCNDEFWLCDDDPYCVDPFCFGYATLDVIVESDCGAYVDIHVDADFDF